MPMLPRGSLLIMLASLASACASERALPDGYPPRPHGTEVGDVFGYFPAMGYLGPEGQAELVSGQPYEAVTMLDVKNAGPSHVLMHLAAMW
jgi:hypothetical protein